MFTSEPNSPFLFVYGSLMSASPHPMAGLLRRFSVLVGEGYFTGQLYDLGEYPGAIYQPRSRSRVYGEVLRLTDPDRLLPELDRYEGFDAEVPDEADEYIRYRVPVTTASRVLECWAYLYVRPVSGLIRIPSGRYLP